MARVTIYMSSYNHARFLRASIESVLNQTFADFELFIEDDASPDESWSIIQDYEDPRIRSFKNPVNRNDKEGMRRVLFELGSGELFAVHHSDNLWEMEKLEKQVSYLDDNPEIGAVFTKAKIIDESGRPLENKAHPYCSIFNQPNRSRYEWLNYLFHHGNALCHPSVLIRKKCFDDCGFHRSGLIQFPDYDMWVRLCLKYDIHVLQDELVRFRVLSHDENLSGNRQDAHLRMQFEVLKVLENYRQLDKFEELVSVFPDARRYYRAGGCVPEYVLAMIALESGGFARQQKELLALNLLFDALNDPARKEKLDSLYGFKQIDFKRLSARYDPFALYASIELAEKGNPISHTLSRPGGCGQSNALLRINPLRRVFNQLKKIGLFTKPMSSAESIYYRIRLRKDIRLMHSSGLFDRDWYLEHNPDVAASRMDPDVHFLLYGGGEQRDPGPEFSSRDYLEQYGDVRKTGINPLLHYIRHGAGEKRIKKIDPSFHVMLKEYNFQGSQFSPVNQALKEWLEPQMLDFFGRSKQIVQREGKLWVIKTGMTTEAIQRELLVYSLSRGLVNTCEIRTLTVDDCQALFELNLTGQAARPENTLLIRLAQDYKTEEIPLKTLDDALAGELVFSLWVRRRDVGDFNHAYTTGGIRMFFDLNMSLDFEPGSLEIDHFFSISKYGYPGYWRVRERAGEFADILTMRERFNEYRYQFIDSQAGFLVGIEEVTRKIRNTEMDLRGTITKCGYNLDDINRLESFLEKTRSTLSADVQKMIQIVFSELPAKWQEDCNNPIRDQI